MLAAYFNLDFVATWDNYDIDINNWSLEKGINALCLNFIIYLFIAVFVEAIYNVRQILGSKFYRKVVFTNSAEGVLKVTDLCDSGKSTTKYGFEIEKSKVCCFIGENSALKTNILRLLTGDRPG